MKQYDAIIIGGGIVGLSLARVLSQHHFSVALVEFSQHTESSPLPNARVSAIHTASQQFLETLGAWALLPGPTQTPFYKMDIWDHTQGAQLQFNAAELNTPQMGFIIDNHALTIALKNTLKNVDIYAPCRPIAYTKDAHKIIITLDNQAQLEATLCIGADGPNSWVRQQMTIETHTRAYQQKAIVAVIQTEKPHHHTAYQKFLTTGPIALLPLHNAHHTALVWSADIPISDDLMGLTDTAFSKKLSAELDFRLGNLNVISERTQFSLTMRHVDQYAQDHFVLAGDAAHTIHPLAGLGLNLGLMDVKALAETLINARHKKRMLYDPRILRSYTRWRKAENTCIINAMRGLQEVFAIDHPIFNPCRTIAINGINQVALLKNLFSQALYLEGASPCDY